MFALLVFQSYLRYLSSLQLFTNFYYATGEPKSLYSYVRRSHSTALITSWICGGGRGLCLGFECVFFLLLFLFSGLCPQNASRRQSHSPHNKPFYGQIPKPKPKPKLVCVSGFVPKQKPKQDNNGERKEFV